ncbi:MAG: hypothetical protein ING29_12485 [Azospirillum sp.]|nr:hypothetical protein [Azospirillum sp.]
MSKASPISDIFPINLSVAGDLTVYGKIGYFHVWELIDTNGGQVLDGRIVARFGDANARAVPCTYNSKIEFTKTVDLVVLSWAAQPGRTALIILAEDAQAFEANNAPTRQLVTSAIGTGLARAQFSVGTSAQIIAAANTLRQSVTIQNRGTAAVAIGHDNLTTVAGATGGLIIDPGGSLTIDKTTAAIWAIAAAAAQDVRTLTELS